jgi:hypothetical protein
MKATLIFISFFTTVLFSIICISCGGSGGGEGDTGSPVQNAIEIETPTAETSFTTDCNEVWVGGEANYPASQWNSVEIAWKNQSASGLSQGMGQTDINQCLGWFFGYAWYYDCNAGWWADVPLEIGSNTITITAIDSNGTVIGRDLISVNKPVMSYYIKGRITNTGGTGLFNMKVKHDAAGGFTYTDSNGNYQLGCLRSGTYSITPDSIGYYSPTDKFFSYIDWPFTPADRTVTVNDSDAIGQDFSTEVYEVSGQITTLSGSGFQNLDVFLMEAGGSYESSRTNENGFYTFMAPNGTYTVQPSTFFSFAPANRIIEVNGSGVYDQDFSAQ